MCEGRCPVTCMGYVPECVKKGPGVYRHECVSL